MIKIGEILVDVSEEELELKNVVYLLMPLSNSAFLAQAPSPI